MMRRPLIAGNWKMHKTPLETEAFLQSLLRLLPDPTGVDTLLLPPYTSLDRAGRLLRGQQVLLGAQDVHPAPSGAFTGAVSAAMLAACGCTHVLVGHSERRHVFGDSDLLVRRKLRTVLDHGLIAVLCIGETLDDRRNDQTGAILERQLDTALDDVSGGQAASLLIAYEPVWAIGTGETASPDQAQSAAVWIRGWLSSRYTSSFAQSTRILYGGSVKPDNVGALQSQPDLDGMLVGGASLDPVPFLEIIQASIAAVDREALC